MSAVGEAMGMAREALAAADDTLRRDSVAIPGERLELQVNAVASALFAIATIMYEAS